MELSTKKIIITTSIVAITALIASPIVGKQIISEKIIEEQNILKTNGIEIAFDKTKGYLESKRKFNGKIVDFQKFANFLINENIKSNISKEKLKRILNKNKNDLNQKFNNTQFEGLLKINNLGLSDIKTKITILDMPFLSEIKKNEKNESLFELFENKKLNFNLTFNKNGEIKKLKMEDLYIKNKINNASIDFKNILILEKMGNKYHSKIDKIEILLDNKGIKFDFLLKNYNLNLTYTNLLNTKIIQEMETIKFKFDEKNKKNKLKNLEVNLNNFSIYSHTYKVGKKVNIENKYKFKNLELKDEYRNLYLNNFETNFDFKNLNEEYTTKIFTEDPKDKIRLENNLIKIINNGLKFNLNTKIDSVEFGQTKIGKISAVSKNTIKENNIKIIKSSFLYLTSENKLTIEEKDLKTYSQLIPIQNFLNKSKKENGLIIFNYNIKDGKEIK